VDREQVRSNSRPRFEHFDLRRRPGERRCGAVEKSFPVGGDCSFAALCFHDNWRTCGSAQRLAELGQYLRRHLVARRFNGWAQPLERIVKYRSDPLNCVLSHPSATLLGRGSYRRYPLGGLVCVRGNHSQGLLRVRRDSVDGSGGQGGDPIRGRVSQGIQSICGYVSDGGDPLGGRLGQWSKPISC